MDKRKRLTIEFLEAHGFTEIKEYYPKTYRKKPANYCWEIQVSIENCPESNPNCGTVGLFKEEDIAYSVQEMKNGEVEEIKTYEPEEMWNIAWYVWDEERFRQIYESITNEKL